MPHSILNNPAHWRERAEETRRMADLLTDKSAREALLRVADSYEELAKKAEQHVLWQQSTQKTA